VIVFEGEDGDLYAMRPDGKGIRAFVLRRPCIPLDFSRDGRVVACATSWAGVDHIYVMNRDGSDRHRVPLSRGAHVVDASLSPDGRQLAITNARTADSFEIWRVSTNGTGAQRLVVEGVSQQPRWSPDGRRIAYVHEARVTACAAGDAVVMDANGRHRRVVARSITVANGRRTVRISLSSASKIIAAPVSSETLPEHRLSAREFSSFRQRAGSHGRSDESPRPVPRPSSQLGGRPVSGFSFLG
jgi:dipeptidyl aminopeptidase/acylaminoacyl peptidase